MRYDNTYLKRDVIGIGFSDGNMSKYRCTEMCEKIRTLDNRGYIKTL